MLAKLKTAAGDPYYKVYAGRERRVLLLTTKDYEEAEARELLIVADEITKWAADFEPRAHYNGENKKYMDERLYDYLKFTYGTGLKMLDTALLCHELNYSISTINQYLMSLRRRGAVSTKKIFNKKYIFIH